MKKIRNRKGSFMVEPKDYRCSLSKLALERKNDYLVAVTMRDKDAREIKSAMFYPDASCVLLVIGNYKKLQKEVLPAREFTLSEMLSKFTPEEALKIAYLPIVLTQAAFRFATAVANECAQRQLDYKKPVREIRAHTKEYIRNIIGGDKVDLINSLENQVCAFLGKAGNDVQTLYFCINTELKKEYPHITEHNLLTNIYICQALCTYVREKEMHYDQLIRMRLSAPYHSTVNKDALAVCKALQEIAGNYKISIHTRIINTAVKVIGIKIDNMNFNCD